MTTGGVTGGTGSVAGGTGGASGGAPESGGTGGGSPEAGAPAATGGSGGAPDPDGYVRSGAWHGWTWTQSSSSASITRPSFTKLPVCASGVVPPTVDANGFATLGVNLNQDVGPGTPPAKGVIPSEAGVFVDVTNKGASPLRLQLVGNVTGDIWCLPLYGGGGFYPWSAFKSQCGAPGGVPYSGTLALTSLSLAVPGNADTPVPFDFCLNDLGEAESGVSGSCDPTNARCSPALIDDFEGRAGFPYSQDGRSGKWALYVDGTGGTQTVTLQSEPGRESAHAIRAQGSGFTEWGSGFGVRLNQPPGAKYHPYDASRYAGVKFWYTSTATFSLRVRTTATTSKYDTFGEGGTCALSVGDCTNFIVELPVAPTWTEIKLTWAELLQPSWSPLVNTALDPKTLVEIRFESYVDTTFDFSVDDLQFF